MRARVSGSIVADPDLARVTAAFNSVLDSIASYRLRLRAVVARAIEKDEEDRRRVARELYDETAQTLAALLLRIRLETEAGADPETLHDLCEEARREIAGAVDVLRGFADRGPPPLLEELGLDAAIQARVRSCRGAFAGVIEFGSTGAGQRLTQATERAVYHVIVEALGNAITHADASRIKVQLDFTPSDLTATVEDDGTGFDLSTVLPTRDVGLTAMRERVVSVGGTLDLESSAGHGTRARIVTPVSEGTKGPA